MAIHVGASKTVEVISAQVLDTCVCIYIYYICIMCVFTIMYIYTCIYMYMVLHPRMVKTTFLALPC